MKTMIIKELKERKYSLMAYCLAAFGFIWLYISLFPFLQSQSQSYTKLLESFPKGFSQAFGIDTSFLSNIEGYMAGEMYSLIWPLLAIILVVSRAGGTFAGEIEKGTIGTLLAQPISRTKLFLSKYAAGVIGFVVFLVASVLTGAPLALAYRLQFFGRHFLTLSLAGLLFGLAIYSFAMMLSAISNAKSQVYGVTGGLLFIMYVFNIVSGLKPNLSWLQYTSVFHYFNASAALVHNRIDLLTFIVFGVSALLFFIVALLLFNKRDISV